MSANTMADAGVFSVDCQRSHARVAQGRGEGKAEEPVEGVVWQLRDDWWSFTWDWMSPVWVRR